MDRLVNEAEIELSNKKTKYLINHSISTINKSLSPTLCTNK